MNKQFQTKFLQLVLILSLTLVWGCTDYGEKLLFNGGELYYTSAVTSSEAQKLGNYLVELKVFDGRAKSIQLHKENGTYEVRFPIKKGIENDPEVIQMMRLLASQISQNVFDGAPVDIHLCDKDFNTIRVVIVYR